MTISEIKEEPCGAAEESTIEQFLLQCTSCGVCRTSCSFLDAHGSPDEIISLSKRDLFLCTNCGACKPACPSGLDPAEALLLAKQLLIETGQVPEQAAKALGSAGRFVQWGASFPFAHYSRAESVFWPGCSLAGMAPDVVLKVQQLLAEERGKAVGITLDCCADPVYEMGDLKAARKRAEAIGKSLDQQGTRTVIAGCANCIKVLRRYLPDLDVKHVLEVLPGKAAASLLPDSIYLHHPCPSYRFEALQGSARRLCGDRKIAEQGRPQCCGQGGGLPALSPGSAEACTRDVFNAAANLPLVTYCMGCKDQFLRQGKQAYHLLELLVSVPPVERPVSSVRKWLNRLVLALRARWR